jgi:hypothetical protein
MKSNIKEFTMFANNLTKFLDFGTTPNCENFSDNMFYYDLLDEYKTDLNLHKYINEKFDFIDENQLLPLTELKQKFINKVHIIAHTKYFWVTLDPSGVYPVLHPKSLENEFDCNIPEQHPDVILFPKEHQTLTKPTDVHLLEISGTITFNIKEIVYAMDKSTGKPLIDKDKLNWVDINTLALNAVKNMGDPYDNGPDGGANYSVNVELKNKTLHGVI